MVRLRKGLPCTVLTRGAMTADHLAADVPRTASVVTVPTMGRTSRRIGETAVQIEVGMTGIAAIAIQGHRTRLRLSSRRVAAMYQRIRIPTMAVLTPSSP
jgi:hypothetical protein